MSSSTSNLPAIILAAAVAVILIGFYIADRSSGDAMDISSITHDAGTDKKIKSKEQFDRSKSVFNHSGYSGSMEEYLKKVDEGFAKGAEAELVDQHTGYTGSGDDYVEHFETVAEKELRANAAAHTAYSGGIDDYLAGNYEKSSDENYSPEHPRDGATQDGGDSNDGYTGSVDEYLKKYGG
ncbi:MAG: hypothetical protein AAGB35_08415 [Pseudomonadota bacterium]